jgi:transposase
MRSEFVVGDGGDSSPTVRRSLRARRIGFIIPTMVDEVPDPVFDREAYRERKVVERLINRLKQWRRIATRYGKRAANYGPCCR